MDNEIHFEIFYKELSKSVHTILKPYRFRKKGNKFFKISEDGFITLIELQKERFNYADESAFQIFCGFAIYNPIVAKDKLHEWCMYTKFYIGNEGTLDDRSWSFGNYYCICKEKLEYPLFNHAVKDTAANIKKMVLEVFETKIIPMIDEINTSKDYFYSKYFHFHFGALDYLFELFDKDVLPYLQEQIDIYSDPSFADHKQAQQLKEYYLKMYNKYIQTR